MSLSRRLFTLMLLVLLGFSLGIFFIQVNNTRDALAERQRVELSNLAQSLSLALVPHVELGDAASAEALIRATVDGGHVRDARLESVAIATPIAFNVVRESLAPEWFRDLIPMPVESASRELPGGWASLGTISLTGESAQGYDQLWQLAKRLALWLLLGGLITLLVASLVMRRLLRPLERLSSRLNEMETQRFDAPLEETSVAELKGITSAVNRLGQRLQTQFEAQAAQLARLQRQAEEDSVSGLGNRGYLNRAVDEWLSEPMGGSFALLRVSHIEVVYREQGYKGRDALVKAIARKLEDRELAGEAIIAARLANSDFGLLLPETDETRLQEFLTLLAEDIDHLLDANPLVDIPPENCAIGAVRREPGMQRTQMFAVADATLRQAIEQGSGVELAPAGGRARPRGEWREIIEKALDAPKGLDFVAQPVLLNDGGELHRELFARLRDGDELHRAGDFLPVIRHFRMGAQFDLRALEWLASYIDRIDVPRLALNLTEETFDDEASYIGLLNWLAAHPRLCKRLDIEVSESIALRHQERIKMLFRHARRLGARGGIDRFARELKELSYLSALRPDYVKIDQAFFKREDVDTELLQSLCMTAHQVESQVIVTRVESEADQERAMSLGADGYQGFVSPAVDVMARLANPAEDMPR
ncbi:EAL domain-containing protein [Cobetia sp. LC6]|uniref:bifunctional diguanylate cyclase/phosphodiesterase n=1 Tax=Cobetia sp. LC6 TaxID=3050947 RepID=UPI002555526F|nr:EAL domain-containing protein [Cobetia sp. LC6]MDL2192395.1 EAL domain-containing protein [Cobetia sp. LC6]